MRTWDVGERMAGVLHRWTNIVAAWTTIGVSVYLLEKVL